MKPARRRLLGALGTGACVLAAPAWVRAQPSPRRLRMLLNTGYSSPQSWLWLAQSEGHLAREGIELDLTPGSGAYTTAPRMISADYDLGYGDVNALIEEVARRPNEAPKGVFMFFPASPSTVAVAASGPIRQPRDLLGKRLIGHDSDVALRTFGAMCLQQGIERERVRVDSTWGGMRGMVQDVLAGHADGAFGYASTFTGAIATAEPPLLPRVRFLNFAQWAPDLYGSVLMASPRLLRDDPDTVSRVVRALNRGLAAWMARPMAGLEALARLHPGTDLKAEGARMEATLRIELRHPDTARLGYGEVDDSRLLRGVESLVRANGLPRVPKLDEVFTRAHLPPSAERVRVG